MGITAERLHDRFRSSPASAPTGSACGASRRPRTPSRRPLVCSTSPVAITDANGAWGLATEDEGRRPETTMEGLAQLKTPFRPGTAGSRRNLVALTDGATVSLLAGGKAVRELGLTPKMRLVSYAFAGVQPEVMGIGPIPSTQKALAKAGLTIDDIGLFELNEAFAVQVLSFLDHYGIVDDDPRVNPWGGAIALGHPLAASGVRS